MRYGWRAICPPVQAWNKFDCAMQAQLRGITIRKWRSRPLSRVLSWTTIPLGLASPQGSSSTPGDGSSQPIVPLFGLAPGGVCRALRRWPRRRWALTPPFRPYHAHLAMPFGGLFSVALSVGSRRPGVTWHPALWSPDFPRRDQVATRLSWPTPPWRIVRECDLTVGFAATRFIQRLPGSAAQLSGASRKDLYEA